MSFKILINSLIHPFILYVLVSTCIGYLMLRLLRRVPQLQDSRWRAAFYSMFLVVPFIALLLRQPSFYDKCLAYGHRLGVVNNWICYGANVVSQILTPLFLGAVMVAFVRLAAGIFSVVRLRKRFRQSTDLECDDLTALVEILSSRASIAPPKLVITKDSYARAFTMGCRTPVIVLSEGLLKGLDNDELETVIAHELGHIVRGDSWQNWALCFLRDFMFFSPFTGLIFRHLKIERENACDDFAIKITGKPLALAQGLIKVWRLSRHSLLDSIVPNPSFAGTGYVVESRVRRIIKHQKNIPAATVYAKPAMIIFSALTIGLLYVVC